MTQVQDMQKRYLSPALTVYGRFEDVTLVWSNPTSTDNTCQAVIGSQTVNSGALCVLGRGTSGGSDAGADASISTSIEDPLAAPIDPLAEDLTGSGAGS